MRIRIDLDQEVQRAVQQHLEGGHSVQDYIRAALRFFDKALELEEKGEMILYSDNQNSLRFNKRLDPSDFL